jgi:hypothetical protein
MRLLAGDLLEKILLKKKFEEVEGSVIKMLELDFNNSKDFVDAKDLQLYFSAKEGLRKAALAGSGGRKPDDVLGFRKDCLLFLHKTAEKLLHRCSLSCKAVKGFSIFSPDAISLEPSPSAKMCELLFRHLHEVGRVDAGRVDILTSEYKQMFTGDGRVRQKAKGFNRLTQSLSDFYDVHILDHLSDEMKGIIRLGLLLFSGQGEVERGFSVNKECLTENLAESSLIAQRRICSYVKECGGLQDGDLPPLSAGAMRCMREAWRKREQHLEEERKVEKAKDQIMAEKRKAVAALKELEKEKKKLRMEHDRRLATLEEESERLEKLAKQ